MIETGEQRIVIHIDPSGVTPAMDAGASLLASARRQEQEEGTMTTRRSTKPDPNARLNEAVAALRGALVSDDRKAMLAAVLTITREVQKLQRENLKLRSRQLQKGGN